VDKAKYNYSIIEASKDAVADEGMRRMGIVLPSSHGIFCNRFIIERENR
jgi:hypothetical protein